MIVRERLQDGRMLTYSDSGKWIRQDDTGIEYETAVDTVDHTYTETNRDIESAEVDPVEGMEILFGGGVHEA